MYSRFVSLAALSLAVLAPLRAERIFAVEAKALLISFDSERPGAITSMALIRGLQAGESIVGIDFRPANKKLYGIGSSSRLYVIDTDTGAATAVSTSPFSPLLDGTEFGFDFNPTVDRIRVTSNRGQNLRLHPDTGAVAAVDGTLRYTDDATPRVVASAYTNSVAGATSTTLFDIDIMRRSLVTQAPPNDGVLNRNLQLMNIDVSDVAGFDISPVNNKGYFAVRENKSTRALLYTIDLQQFSAQMVGQIGFMEQVSSIAVEPPTPRPTLFSRLGGKDAIVAVVDEFVSIVAADSRINSFFGATAANPQRLAAFKTNLVEQVCMVSGGPCTYQGKDMKTAHRGMMIGDAEFDALVDDLVKALDRFKVPVEEKAALLAILSPLRGDIVEKKQQDILLQGLIR
jgi:truncated hemoglobin YjbI